ncbi:MAG: hypothetical protein ACXADC_10310 [Candidatus Thorarchaeota archaeon]|jgi:hypothetical protein
MSELDTLRKGFIAFLDGLWWGLRDNVGALSMYEGYAGGFRQMGAERAEADEIRGPEAAAKTAADLFRAIGLEVDVNGKEVLLRACPLWDRILERGLEYAFHVEDICWKPMLEGIGEKARAKPSMVSALRLIYLEKAKAEHKRSKAKATLDKGDISREEYNLQVEAIDNALEEIPSEGRYRFD